MVFQKIKAEENFSKRARLVKTAFALLTPYLNLFNYFTQFIISYLYTRYIILTLYNELNKTNK